MASDDDQGSLPTADETGAKRAAAGQRTSGRLRTPKAPDEQQRDVQQGPAARRGVGAATNGTGKEASQQAPCRDCSPLPNSEASSDPVVLAVETADEGGGRGRVEGEGGIQGGGHQVNGVQCGLGPDRVTNNGCPPQASTTAAAGCGAESHGPMPSHPY